jgi:hypothetical protein
VDRWSARWYAALLDVLRTRGATASAPAPSCVARRTGLHAADKVPAHSVERIRRRYNVDGALEYFLEPARLRALRKEAGVEEPFWVLPSGWKLADPTSPEAVACAVKKKVQELAAELAVVKRSHLFLLLVSYPLFGIQFLPTSRTAETVALSIRCNAGSVLNANCHPLHSEHDNSSEFDL